MPSLKNVLPISARQAGYLDLMIPTPLPEPIPLLQAASMDTVMAALVALPQELRQKPGLHVVMLRDRHRVLLLEGGALHESFPVAIGMSGWETPTGRFKVLEKIDNPVWVHPVSGDRVADQSSANPLGSHWIGFHRESQCCVRLLNENVRTLYGQVRLGTPDTVLP